MALAIFRIYITIYSKTQKVQKNDHKKYEIKNIIKIGDNK